jgi:hypothetical protein
MICIIKLSYLLNRIGGVIVSVLARSVVDREFEPRSGQIKNYEIGICCFFAKHAALEWLLFNDNSAIFQLYHGEKKLIFIDMMMKSALF